MKMEIPTGPQWLTADWLTGALRKNGFINQARVKSFLLAALDLGQGITGQLFRVMLAYDIDEEQAPLSLIAKFSTTNQVELEVMFTEIYHYEREIRFYERIAGSVRLGTPRCYYRDLDVDARQFILLTEDLAPARSGSSELGCSPQEAELAMREIANLRAAQWEYPGFSEMSTRLPQWGMDQFTVFHDLYQEGWPWFCEKMGGRLSQEMAGIGKKLARHVTAVMEYNIQPLRTLTHYDYQLDNIFFPQSNATDTLIVVDWQLVTIGRGASDIAFFWPVT